MTWPLPESISPGDAGETTHAEEVHTFLNTFDHDTAPAVGDAWVWDGSSWVPDSGYRRAYQGVQAKLSASQSISNSSNTTVNWDAEDWDTDTFHDNATNNSRITIPSGADGRYRCEVMLNWAANSTGRRLIKIRKNGTDIARMEQGGVASGTVQGQTIWAAASMTAGDYFDVLVFQNSGGSLNLDQTNGFNTIHVERLS